ncbi:hypothetical protein IGC89_000222 [Escherichia coli]|nr:hypothetical protein [Escherichia coli]EFM4248515.1 hypothetical protein [Escherichia coli]EGI3121366.1 hypothetical protein [Escherichia coli]EGI3126663.1 hypothetical protein [Escherichia coli]EGI3140273.1 hypothetical protein [Escherichia coli]
MGLPWLSVAFALFINGAWKLAYYRPPKELGLKIGDKLFAAPPAPLTDPERQELKKLRYEDGLRQQQWAQCMQHDPTFGGILPKL